MKSTTVRYSKWMMALHWSTAVLVIGAYACSDSSRRFRPQPPIMHFVMGSAVLLLTVCRLGVRRFGGAPPYHSDGMPRLAAAAKLGHALLYLLLILVPVTGCYALLQLDIPLVLWGFTMPVLHPPRLALFGQVHQILGNLILWLAGLHAGFALWHHFARRSGTLRRMMPF
jgi:cytochrome b561